MCVTDCSEGGEGGAELSIEAGREGGSAKVLLYVLAIQKMAGSSYYLSQTGLEMAPSNEAGKKREAERGGH